MARRADHSRKELTDLILSSACHIVGTEGLSALSARKVARDIGYTAGTLYNIFENIDDLTLHVHARTLEGLYQAILPALNHKGPEETLYDIIELYLDYIQHHSNSWNALFEPGSWKNKELPDWYKAKVERPFSIVEKALQSYFTEDQKDQLNLTSRILWSSVHGICSLAISDKLDVVSKHEITTMTNSLIHNYLVGLKHDVKGSNVE